MLNIEAYRIHLVAEPQRQVAPIVKEEVVERRPAMDQVEVVVERRPARDQVLEMRTPDSIGERRNVTPVASGRGSVEVTARGGNKRMRELAEEEESRLSAVPPESNGEGSEYLYDEDGLDELEDELDSSADEGGNLPLAQSRSQPPKPIKKQKTADDPNSRKKIMTSVAPRDRVAFEWLKEKLERWDLQGARGTFLYHLEKPVSFILPYFHPIS